MFDAITPPSAPDTGGASLCGEPGDRPGDRTIFPASASNPRELTNTHCETHAALPDCSPLLVMPVGLIDCDDRVPAALALAQNPVAR